MPCRSDYMEPNALEIEHSKVLALLDELEHGKLNRDNYGKGSGKAYNASTKDTVDQNTRELCKRLKNVKDIEQYSLELRMWWRDHQAADERRARQADKDAHNREVRRKALTKLTDKEKKVLGLN